MALCNCGRINFCSNCEQLNNLLRSNFLVCAMPIKLLWILYNSRQFNRAKIGMRSVQSIALNQLYSFTAAVLTFGSYTLSALFTRHIVKVSRGEFANCALRTAERVRPAVREFHKQADVLLSHIIYNEKQMPPNLGISIITPTDWKFNWHSLTKPSRKFTITSIQFFTPKTLVEFELHAVGFLISNALKKGNRLCWALQLAPKS